jgi:hypothetical protein
MTFTKSSLLINNKSISVIENEGIINNYAPIQGYYQLSKTDLKARQTYKFSLDPPGIDLLPKSITASLSNSNTQIDNNDSFTIKVYNGTSYQWGLDLAGKKNIDPQGFHFIFPQIPISRNHTIEIESAIDLAAVFIFFEPIYIEQTLIKTD